jgi:hypothetical protein
LDISSLTTRIQDRIAMFIQTKTRLSPELLQGRLLEDRRRSPRVPAMMSAWLWRAEDAEAPEESNEPLAIHILDYSDRGIGFICPLPLDMNEKVELDMEGDGKRRTRLRVTQCDLHGNMFRVGAFGEGKLPRQAIA